MKLVQIDASKGKASILAAFAAQFAFPKHYGQNWDALEDCLNDAMTSEDGPVRVHISARNAAADDMSVLGSIMALAANEHGNLSVTFDHGAEPSQPTKVA